MISTFHHTQRSSRSSKVKAVLGESPSNTEVEADSFDAQRDMLMNIIHQHFDRSEQGDDNTKHNALLGSLSSHGHANSQGNKNGNSRRSASVKRGVRHRRRTSLNLHTHVAPAANEPNVKKARRVLDINPVETTPTPAKPTSPHTHFPIHLPYHTNTHTNSHTHKHTNISTYQRPTGPELVSARHPSCSNLPSSWNYIHDRFIAYLATHAPLDRKRRGDCEEWRSEEIAGLLGERFPRLFSGGGGYDSGGGGGGLQKKIRMIENRLALLDEAGDNEYFQMPYGAYMYEEWGTGI